MKHGMIFLITAYQAVCSPLLRACFGLQRICRYTPSCSEYIKQRIQKDGMIMGTWLGWKRLMTCW